MEKNLITLIIPVYNTPKKFFKRLIESIKNQTNKQFELIIVDDGSIKECAEYIDKVTMKINCCKVLHKEHSGVSASRNFAINMVCTRYIAFSDADDLILPNFIQDVVNYITEYDVDIIYGTLKYVPEKKLLPQSGQELEIYSGSDQLIEVKKALLNIFPRKLPYTILGTPCARCYKTSLVKKTLFNEKISFYEDQIFNREILSKANTVMIVPDVWYYYFQNDFSAMHNERNKNFYSKTKLYWDIFYAYNQKEPNSFRDSLRIQQLDFFYAVINYDYVLKNKNNLKDINRELKIISNHPMIKDIIDNTCIKETKFTFLDILNIKMIKYNLFWILYIEKYIINKLKKLVNQEGII